MKKSPRTKKRPPAPALKIATAEETVPLSEEQRRAYLKSPAHKKQLRDQNNRERNLAEAASAPLPGPLRDAFATDPPDILGIKLQPVSATHVAILTQIGNPFAEGIRYGILCANAKSQKEREAFVKKASTIKETVEDAVEVLYLFSLTPPEARLILAQGRAAIRAKAIEMMDTKLPPIQLTGLGAMLGQHYSNSFATQIQHRVVEGDKSGTLNFPKPASRTDLAGSSKSSAA